MSMKSEKSYYALSRGVDLRAAQYLDPLSAQLVHPSLTHLIAGLGMFDSDVEVYFDMMFCLRILKKWLFSEGEVVCVKRIKRTRKEERRFYILLYRLIQLRI